MTATSEDKKSFVIVLRPAPKYGEPGTEKIIENHFSYLEKLLGEGILMMAGRFSEVLFGLTIIETDSIESARSIMENDPAIKSGIFFGQLYPWRVALRK
ncbi:MAG: hypothetical protein JSW61_00610 [Candidatus Thorarchaeota archaeon]|nr:MAG: hypothetical protein JSW61_00610 [Candidatus Thorarchaeota archaeon]